MDIEKIKELKANATQGEWEGCGVDYGSEDEIMVETDSGCHICDNLSVSDAKFIAALPEIAQLAIDQAEEIKRLNDIIDEMVGEI